MITLNDFMSNELKTFHLPVNKKNLAKLRNKYTKELKSKNLWNSTQTEINGKSKTKLFKEEDLQQISRKLYKYMTNLVIQESGFSRKEILTEAKKNSQELEDSQRNWIDFINTHTQDEVYAYEHRFDYDPAPPANEQQKQKGLNELMLTALFNKFFNMTIEQKELFFNDLSTKYWDYEEVADNPNFIVSQKRLEHPEKYYYSEKEEAN